MINLIAFIICAAGAIYQYHLGNIGWAVIEGVFALINFLAYIVFHKR